MKTALSVAFFLAILFLLPLSQDNPSLESLDAESVRLGLAFFACIACLWMSEALPLAITALLVPVLGTALGLTNLQDSLKSFAHPLIFLFLGGFALASALSAQGLDRWLAGKLSALGKGKFLPVSLLLFLGTALLSMWMSNTATAAMMIPLALGILGNFQDNKNEQNSRFLLLGLAYSASIGGLGTIVGSPPNGIAAKQLDITFAQWMAFGIPTVAILLPTMAAVLYFLLKPTNTSASAGNQGEMVAQFQFTKSRIVTLSIFALTALSWMFSKPLGDALSVKDMDTWIAISAIILLAVTKVVTWKQIESSTEWGVLLLFGGGLALSSILQTSGTSLFMARILGETVIHWPLLGIIAGVVAFVIFLTELSSNTATAALLVPIFYTMATEFQLAPAQLILPLALASSCAFMLPVGTPPNAIVFATGRIPQKSMIRSGIVLNLLFVALIAALSLVLF
ncbi:SLC13 family permease [Luteolibacter sp. AS25]|uniref:SLC13 family permease n=1 Tax=Luteolibacter sp. AS25 TaxID=3135776 RepID=UPI00398A97DA